jgi:hypothetical protein
MDKKLIILLECGVTCIIIPMYAHAHTHTHTHIQYLSINNWIWNLTTHTCNRQQTPYITKTCYINILLIHIYHFLNFIRISADIKWFSLLIFWSEWILHSVLKCIWNILSLWPSWYLTVIITVAGIWALFIYLFSSLSHDRAKASSKASSPHSAF